MDNPQPAANTTPVQKAAAPSVYELEGSRRPMPVVPILLAVVIIAVSMGALLYFTKQPPVASATINKIVPVEQITKDRVLVTIEATVKNLSPKEIWVRGVDVKIVTLQGEAHDVPAPAVDLPRYFKAYPALKQSDAPPLIDNTKILAGAEQAGMFVVGFPVTKDAFDKRQSIEVTIHLYGQRPLVIKQ